MTPSAIALTDEDRARGTDVYLARARAKALPDAPTSAFEAIRRYSSHLVEPTHFAAYAGKLDTACGAGMRIVFSAPPQHGKTELTLHGLLTIVMQHPDLRHAYATYSMERALDVATNFCHLLDRAGVKYRRTRGTIRFPAGGSIKFASCYSGLTGAPIDGVLVVDDPYPDFERANSAAYRRRVNNAWTGTFLTRLHPGASVVVMATRWHPLDLSGVLIDGGTEAILLPAIAEANDYNGREVGEPLWPEQRPLLWLLERKREVLDHTWAALYQCRPRALGAGVFHDPVYYDVLPTSYRRAHGIDLAYTAKKSADWSVMLELWREENLADASRPVFYVVHVERRQCEINQFADVLRGALEQYPDTTFTWRAISTERGSAAILRRPAPDGMGLPIEARTPPGDKLVSATEVAVAWNDGRVRLPNVARFPLAALWLKAFLKCVLEFTGVGDEQDDDVDALGNAHLKLRVGGVGGSNGGLIVGSNSGR